jgi:hypothetical protein
LLIEKAKMRVSQLDSYPLLPDVNGRDGRGSPRTVVLSGVGISVRQHALCAKP